MPLTVCAQQAVPADTAQQAEPIEAEDEEPLQTPDEVEVEPAAADAEIQERLERSAAQVSSHLTVIAPLFDPAP